ncbi:MAG: cation diffusion facilitator family transporter [Lachnospiraceae bacterium]|nr:cation diffusion facilitator family transporter [Lachnospiraceae bacterium]
MSNYKQDDTSRGRTIVRTSIIGICANVFLAAFKAFVGLLTNSIAVVLDAVNNISDAASSLITIIGTRLAERAPDKKHPFGYGRIEYLSAMVISVIVLYAGITSFVESVKKIIEPDVPEYNIEALVIIAVGVVVKIVLGRYVKAVGVKVNSDSLVNSGEDATLDSIISASTFVAAIIYMMSGVSLEAWLGAIISLVIVKAGFEMIRETISQLLGENTAPELSEAIRENVLAFEEVHGVYDLVLHNYGPDTYTGSLHIEVDDTCPATRIDQLIREITESVYLKNNILLTAIGIYTKNTHDAGVNEIHDRVSEIVLAYDNVSQIHGFYADLKEKYMRFDTVISFDEEDRAALFNRVIDEVRKEYPDYRIVASLDTEF